MTIFVSIAAYRDPELVPTIEHALATARWPGDLRFGICWQHGEGETPPPALDAGRMRVIDVPWRESKGACWARAEVMTLYDGEDYFLQLDSHHRFVEGWDAALIDQAERSGSAKPLLTAYLPAYTPGAPLPPQGSATGMRLDRFSPEGIPTFLFRDFPAGRGDAPVRARFVSGHMLFAPGSFVADVPYDPDLYFIGEEITLAVRAFTHGYDLFHPGVPIAWHEYTRAHRTKHWDDHVPGGGVEKPWHERDRASLDKVKNFLIRPTVGPYGCGAVRSFAEYESYGGVNFRRRFASQAALEGAEPAPPVPAVPLVAHDCTIRLALDDSGLGPDALDNPRFWYVGFHDSHGAEIARADAGRDEIGRAVASAADGRIVLSRRVVAPHPPQRWTVWPTDSRGRWLERIDGAVEECVVTEGAA